MASKQNKKIEKVVKDLDEMSADENERLEAYKRKLSVWDYNVSIAEATERGKLDGVEEGKQKEKLEIAKKLKQKGIDTKAIIEITGKKLKTYKQSNFVNMHSQRKI